MALILIPKYNIVPLLSVAAVIEHFQKDSRESLY